jgi:uncharacterized surface protein with fasciclin (FAS1) repeats
MSFKSKFIALNACLISLAVLISTPVMAKKPSERITVVDLAVFANSEEGPFPGVFDTLIDLVSSDEVVLSKLSGNGQYTVFAPTDDAFGNLMTALGANCIVPTSDDIRSILLYHVVRGRRDAANVIGSDQLRTLNGAFFNQSGGMIMDVAGQTANIIVTDVFADNGVIHAIDTVILPFEVPNLCTP